MSAESSTSTVGGDAAGAVDAANTGDEGAASLDGLEGEVGSDAGSSVSGNNGSADGESDAASSTAETTSQTDTAVATGDTGTPPESHVVRFGEHPDADISGVTADTWIVAGSNQNHGSHYDLHLSSTIHVLIRFDISAIPPSAEVSDAELTLHTCEFPGSGQDVALRPVSEAWSEGNQDGGIVPANWFDRIPGEQWNVPGGEVWELAAEFVTDGSGTYVVSLPVDVVQTWVDNAASNHGLMLTSGSDDEFYLSGTGNNPDCRPLLQVEYVD